MAILTAPFKISGSIGEYSCYQTRNGKTVFRRHGGPRPGMFHKHPRFERSRENSAEFGGASVIAGQIGRMFSSYKLYFSEGSHFNRLTGLVSEIAKFDPVSVRGQRNLFDGNVYLLEGFQWNKKLSFRQALDVEYSHFTDRISGKAEVQFDSFVPVAAIKAPAGASHFQIVAKAGVLYEGKNPKMAITTASKIIKLHGEETGTITLEMDVDLGDNKEDGLIITGAGIIFYEEEMGALLPLRGGAFGLVGVERTISYDTGRLTMNKETGELTDSRKEAVKRQKAFIDKFGYGIIKDMLPITNDAAEREDMIEKRKRLEHRLWLKKLDKYRGV